MSSIHSDGPAPGSTPLSWGFLWTRVGGEEASSCLCGNGVVVDGNDLRIVWNDSSWQVYAEFGTLMPRHAG